MWVRVCVCAGIAKVCVGVCLTVDGGGGERREGGFEPAPLPH